MPKYQIETEGGKYVVETDEAPAAAMPAQSTDTGLDKALNYHTGNNFVDAPLGFLQGAAKGAIEHVNHAARALDKIPAVQAADDAYNKFIGRSPTTPEQDDALTKPSGIGQGTGKFAEGVAEYALPAAKVTKLTAGASLAARMLAQGATSGAVSALDTGGDKTASTVGTLTGAGGEVIAPVLSAVASKAGGAAAKLYQSALKPSVAQSPADVKALVDTGLKEGVPISETGYKKIYAALQDLSTQTKDTIAQGAASGATVDPASVVGRLAALRAKFGNQVLPEADKATIDNARTEFLRQHSTPGTPATPGTTLYGANGQPVTVGGTGAIPPQSIPIPVDQAQALKQGTYKVLQGKYGEQGSASTEAQKALARGLKEEIYNQFPQLKDIGQREGSLIDLSDAVGRAVNRIGNSNPISLGTAVLSGGHLGPAAVLNHVLTPAVKSRLAIALVKADAATPAIAGTAKLTMRGALEKVNEYANQIAGSLEQPTGQPAAALAP